MYINKAHLSGLKNSIKTTILLHSLGKPKQTLNTRLKALLYKTEGQGRVQRWL